MAKQNSQNELSKKHIAHSERTRRQQRWVIIGISAVLALIVLVLGFGVIDQTYLQSQRAVAKVGSEKITVTDFKNQTQLARLENVQQFNYNQAIMNYALQLSDFQTYLQAMYNMQNIQTQMTDANTFASNYLDSMVADVILRKEASNLSPAVMVSDSDVEESLHKLFSYYPNGTPTAEPTATIWATPTYSKTLVAVLGPTATEIAAPTQDLTSVPTATVTDVPTTNAQVTATPAVTLGPAGTPTAYTMEGYKANLQEYLSALKKYDLTEADLREYWKTQLLRQRVFAAVTSDVPPVADQVWARHILVSTEDEANKVINRLISGEDWTALASEVSIDTGTKSIGGDLGWFPKGAMIAEFEDAAFAIEYWRD